MCFTVERRTTLDDEIVISIVFSAAALQYITDNDILGYQLRNMVFVDGMAKTEEDLDKLGKFLQFFMSAAKDFKRGRDVLINSQNELKKVDRFKHFLMSKDNATQQKQEVL